MFSQKQTIFFFVTPSYKFAKRIYSTMNQKPKFIDSHVHIDSVLESLKMPLSEVNLLLQNQFFKMPDVKGKLQESSGEWEASIHISCEPKTILAAQELLKIDHIFIGAGIHPHHAKDYNEEIEKSLIELHKNKKVVGWGEIGLDYHYSISEPSIQREVFIRQIKAAISILKPLIIHTRNAEEDTLSILKEHVPSDWKIHIHCFTSSLNFAQKLLENFTNLVFGFTGIVTFKNSQDVQDVVSFLPLDRIVLETDGPYLAPVPYRGQSATSGMIPKIAEKIAILKSVSVDIVYKNARKNTEKIYGI